METFSFRDIDIRYVRTGSGPPVVMLHNGGTSHVIWDALIPQLPGYEIFALDLLGFGASSVPDGGYELEHHVAILGAFIDALGLAPAFLVGNCMGSATALSYAAQHAGAVRAMVLFNTLTTATYSAGLLGPLRSLPRRAPSLVSRMSNIALGSRLGKVAVRAQLGRDGIARRVHDRADLHALYERSSQSRSLLAVLEDIPSYAALDRFEPPDDFPPIFSIWGLDNRVLPARVGRTLMKTLRPARQEWFERCGHLAMLERPEAIAELILDFFAATAGSEPSDA